MKGGVEKRGLPSRSLGDVCCVGWMAAAGGKKELRRKKKGRIEVGRKESRQESMHDETTNDIAFTLQGNRAWRSPKRVSRNFVPGASDKMRVVNSQAAWN